MGDEMRDVMRDLHGGLIINPPPDDRRCAICRRHVDELASFGGPGDPLVGDFSGAKLVKHWREDYPGCVGASWDCRDCIVRRGGSWELAARTSLVGPCLIRSVVSSATWGSGVSMKCTSRDGSPPQSVKT